MAKNWIRAYKLVAGPAGGEGFSINALKINFSLSKTEDETCNNITISIWNLNEEHKDDTTRKIEITNERVDVECGEFSKLSMTDTSVDMKCGNACSLGLSPAKISLTAPVIEVNGLATIVTSTAFGVNTVLFPVSTVPVPGAIPPVDEIPGVKDAITSAEGAVK